MFIVPSIILSLTHSSIRFYLSERFRLRFEDSGLEDMMDEDGELDAERAQSISESLSRGDTTDEAIDVTPQINGAKASDWTDPTSTGVIRTLDGDIAGDEFASDAINYQVLLGKIDTLLDRLKLDA